jgi:CheY-like chemotaxis protein
MKSSRSLTHCRRRLEALPKRHEPRPQHIRATIEERLRPERPGAGDQCESATPSPSRLARTLVGVNALVVDDDSASLDFFAAVLKICGATVMTASSALDALGLMQERRPDVVLSDIAMVGQDGYWLVREIRALPDHAARALPIVATTAYGREHSRDMILAGGFNDFLPKPVDPELLCRAIAKAVGR